MKPGMRLPTSRSKVAGHVVEVCVAGARRPVVPGAAQPHLRHLADAGCVGQHAGVPDVGAGAHVARGRRTTATHIPVGELRRLLLRACSCSPRQAGAAGARWRIERVHHRCRDDRLRRRIECATEDGGRSSCDASDGGGATVRSGATAGAAITDCAAAGAGVCDGTRGCRSLARAVDGAASRLHDAVDPERLEHESGAGLGALDPDAVRVVVVQDLALNDAAFLEVDGGHRRREAWAASGATDPVALKRENHREYGV